MSTRSTSARDEILSKVRAGSELARRTGGTQKAERPAFPRFADGLDSVALRLEALRERLDAVGAQSAVARDARDAGRLLRAWLDEREAVTLAHSDLELAAEVAREARDAAGHGTLELIAPTADRETLLETSAGVTGAQLGIAETGTLALASAVERSRLTSLVPPLAVAVLPVDQIEATLEDALARLKPDAPDQHSRAITFVTGPSRTADIEMTLVVGVHGPKELFVLLLDPTAPALDQP